VPPIRIVSPTLPPALNRASATARQHRDEAFALEDADCFAHRAAAELELVGQLLFADALARHEAAGDDAIADLGGDLPAHRQRRPGGVVEPADLDRAFPEGDAPEVGVAGAHGRRGACRSAR
jgi:hypothetical protein